MNNMTLRKYLFTKRDSLTDDIIKLKSELLEVDIEERPDLTIFELKRKESELLIIKKVIQICKERNKF